MKDLITGEMSMDLKYKILGFLIGDIINEDDLKTIPLEHIMRVVILVHLFKNNSMTMSEVTALTKAILFDGNKSVVLIPKSPNVRAFRVNVLYEEMFMILAMCLSPLGMNEFIVIII